MRRSLQSVVLVVAFTALPGCGTTPAAPTPASSEEFDPTALFTRLAGPYTLTIEADESCPVPPSVEVLNYDVLLHIVAVPLPGRPRARQGLRGRPVGPGQRRAGVHLAVERGL